MSSEDDMPDLPSELKIPEEPPIGEFYVWVFYKGNLACKCHVRHSEAGCKITCIRQDLQGDDGLHHRLKRLNIGTPRDRAAVGRRQASQRDQDWKLLNLPLPSKVTGVMARHHDKIIKHLDCVGDGVQVSYDQTNGCLIGERLSNCNVFHAYPLVEVDYSRNCILPLCLPRKRKTCLFNSIKYWERYEDMRKSNKTEKPKAVLSLGETWSLSKSLESCPISMTVIHALDQYMYQQQQERLPQDTFHIEISPDSSIEYSTCNPGQDHGEGASSAM